MIHPLRIVYAGTPEFAVPALKALLHSPHRVLAVYTQPDRPAGRGKQIKVSPVKQCAQAQGLAVEQPLNFREAATLETLRRYAPDVLVVAAYGLLLPQAVLDIPRLACLNIHASLLPRWRGAAPIQRALLAGDRETGVTIMRMEAGLDTGPMLSLLSMPIGAQDNAATLHERLARLGAAALLDALEDLPAALTRTRTQPNEGVTYAKKLSKEEALVDWSRSAQEINRQIRAFNPWPVAETRLEGAQLRIWQARLSEQTSHALPGTVLEADHTGISVATGTGVLILTQVQLAGRKAISAAEFVKAHALAGRVLGEQA